MKLRKLNKSSCLLLKNAITAYIEKADEKLADALADAGYFDSQGTLEVITSLEDELRSILTNRMKYIITRIGDYDGVADFLMNQWSELKNADDMVEELKRTFSSSFGGVIPDYVSGYIERIDPELVALGMTHETSAWIETWSNELAQLMHLNTNESIEKVLSDAVQNGTSIQDVTDAIANNKIRDPGYRARRVATTEILRAHSVAQQESFNQNPSVTQKMWRHSGFRTYSRENHIDMDGSIVDYNEPFVLYGADGGIYYPMFPRDGSLPAGESVNCGCIMQPIVDESVLGLSLEERLKLQAEAIAELDEEFDARLDEQNMQLALRE